MYESFALLNFWDGGTPELNHIILWCYCYCYVSVSGIGIISDIRIMTVCLLAGSSSHYFYWWSFCLIMFELSLWVTFGLPALALIISITSGFWCIVLGIICSTSTSTYFIFSLCSFPTTLVSLRFTTFTRSL